MKLLLLIFLIPNIAFSQLGFYPGLNFGIRFGDNDRYSYNKERESLHFYGSVSSHLLKFKSYDKKTNLKLLGGSVAYSDQEETFYTIIPVSFQTDFNWQMNLEYVLDNKKTRGGSFAVSIGYAF